MNEIALTAAERCRDDVALRMHHGILGAHDSSLYENLNIGVVARLPGQASRSEQVCARVAGVREEKLAVERQPQRRQRRRHAGEGRVPSDVSAQIPVGTAHARSESLRVGDARAARHEAMHQDSRSEVSRRTTADTVGDSDSLDGREGGILVHVTKRAGLAGETGAQRH